MVLFDQSSMGHCGSVLLFIFQHKTGQGLLRESAHQDTRVGSPLHPDPDAARLLLKPLTFAPRFAAMEPLVYSWAHAQR